MRSPRLLLFAILAGLTLAGCTKKFDGPTIDSFSGKVTQDGKTVSFPAGEKVTVQLIHEKGQSFGIPINSDGTFKIGWMPTGKYSGLLKRDKQASKAKPSIYTIPNALTIQEGQTEYVIDLGKNWKP